MATINNVECINCINNSCELTRHQFINRCLPFVDVKYSDINILNFDKTDYIYYDKKNTSTYYINKNFKFSKECNIKYIDRSFSLLDYLNYYIRIRCIKIPIYYLFVNRNNNIFNIFITAFDIYCKKNNCKKKKDLLCKIFSIDKQNIFVKFSLKFNIFNVSLLCNKFYDIFALFLDDNIEEQYLKIKIIDIFKEYDLNNLDTMISNYKFNLNNINKNDYTKIFINQKIKQSLFSNNLENIKNIDTYKNIIDIEKYKFIGRSNNATIIKRFVDTIILFKNVFKEILIKDFNLLFLMSILSYRFREKLINNTWFYDINFYYDFINKNKKEDVNLNLEELKQYYDIDMPIYDNSQVNYKNNEYGNCMESTILQFLKIIFWDYELKKYDFEIIEKLLNEKYYEKIKNVFYNINEEKSKEFDLNWVIFVTELPSIEDEKYENYNFIRKDVNVELNPCFDNLMIFLKYIIKEKFINSNSNITNIELLNIILQELNEDYSISYEKQDDKEIIIIYVYKEYKMILTSEIHAKFEITTNNNILENYKNNHSDNLIKYLKEKINITYSDIKFFMIINFIEDEKNELFKEYYLKINSYDIWTNYFDYLSEDNFFWEKIKTNTTLLNSWKIQDNDGDTVWHYVCQGLNLDFFYSIINENSEILESWKIQNNNGDTVWHYACNNMNNDINYDINFFNSMSTNSEILESWKIQNNNGDTVWHYALKYLSNNFEFWINISINSVILESWKIQNNNGDTVWHYALKYLSNNFEFWINISINSVILLKTWSDIKDAKGNTLWHNSISLYKNNEFWNNISMRYEILDTWKLQNNKGDTVWHLACSYLSLNNIFFNTIKKNCKIIETWTIQNIYNLSVWHIAVMYIRDMNFWNTIIINYKTLINIWWIIKDNENKTIWHNLIYRLRKNNNIDFFNNISKYPEILKTWILQDNTGNTVWHNACQYLYNNVDFFNNISKYPEILNNWTIQNKTGDTVWHDACYHLNNNIDFFNNISKYPEILNNWTIQNKKGDTVWHNACQYLYNNVDFFNSISKYPEIIIKWEIKNYTKNMVWHKAVEFLLSNEIFWLYICNNYHELLVKIWSEKNEIKLSVCDIINKTEKIPSEIKEKFNNICKIENSKKKYLKYKNKYLIQKNKY